MAIIVEQENKGRGVVFFVIIGIAALLISVSTFYLFFKNPKITEKIISPQVKTLAELEKLNLDPSKVLNDPLFAGLKDQIPLNLPDSQMIGKQNLFMPQ